LTLRIYLKELLDFVLFWFLFSNALQRGSLLGFMQPTILVFVFIFARIPLFFIFSQATTPSLIQSRSRVTENLAAIGLQILGDRISGWGGDIQLTKDLNSNTETEMLFPPPIDEREFSWWPK